MDDIDGCPDDLRERDGARGRFRLDTWRTARGVVLGIRLALVQQALAQELGRLAILSVDEHERTMEAGLVQHLEQHIVVDHGLALVGHEQFEAGDTHLWQPRQFVRVVAARSTIIM